MITKPSLGRIVLVTVAPQTNNGADIAPAVITRVWRDDMVNVRVLLDGVDRVPPMTSIDLHPDEPAARAAIAKKRDELAAAGGHVEYFYPAIAFWPARV